MRQRRADLGYESREALAAASGLSLRRLGDIEREAARNLRAATLSKLDRALRWAPGSAENILGGGGPTMADSVTPTAATDRAVAAVTAARQKIIHATPEQLFEIRALIEDQLGREAADEWTLKALRVREAGRAALAEERRERERQSEPEAEPIEKHAG